MRAQALVAALVGICSGCSPRERSAELPTATPVPTIAEEAAPPSSAAVRLGEPPRLKTESP